MFEQALDDEYHMKTKFCPNLLGGNIVKESSTKI